ncbi:hypothetical protein [Microlunatus ginsengisoli]|uniref:Uncharacterized protein n=1 Tax=Microlunatus ginsengisoli TaxID=363863 RepID=A0ABP6ZJW7_9ACTN
MSDESSTSAQLADTAFARRGLLKRTALVAGIAAGAATLAARPEAALAADGDPLELGSGNEADSTTTLRIGGDSGGAAPALALENADGPSLKLQPLSAVWPGQLDVGEMVGTDLGPLVGVDLPGGATTTYLATGADLASMPTPFATAPVRRLDLRTAAGRAAVIRRSSANALTAGGKLAAGQWIDIGLAVTGDDYALQAVFANLTVTGAAANGFAALYPPGVRPVASTINYVKGQTLANFAFVAAGVVQGYHTVRLYSSSEAWFLLDVSGGVNVGNSLTPLSQAARAKGGRAALIGKLRKALSAAVG